MMYYTVVETSYAKCLPIFQIDGSLCWLSLHPKTFTALQAKTEVLNNLKPNEKANLFPLKEPIDESVYPIKKLAQIIDDPIQNASLAQTIKVNYTLLSPSMSDTTRKVWDYLRSDTQVGKTTTYGDIAKDLGMAQGPRAVARACAVNKVAVVIPCHRVLTKDGGYSGYRWGVDFKQELLRREGAVIQHA